MRKTACTIERVVAMNYVSSTTYETLSQFRVKEFLWNLFIWSISHGAFWVSFNLPNWGKKYELALRERSNLHWLTNVGNNQAVCGSTWGMLITRDLGPPTPHASAGSSWLDAPRGVQDLLAQRHFMALKCSARSLFRTARLEGARLIRSRVCTLSAPCDGNYSNVLPSNDLSRDSKGFINF